MYQWNWWRAFDATFIDPCQSTPLDALGLDEDGIKAAIAWQEEGDTEGEQPPLAASRYVSLEEGWRWPEFSCRRA